MWIRIISLKNKNLKANETKAMKKGRVRTCLFTKELHYTKVSKYETMEIRVIL